MNTKLILVLSAVFVLTVSAERCSGDSKDPVRYKGKLEVKGLCMNYTLSLLEGKIDTTLINASWTDEMTGKTYRQAFGLGNPCQFPDTIKEGDEFYFYIDSSKQENCAVCMAYYPTPSHKLSVKVVPK